jgi:2-polyprenyl-6-methoxyphenol hydroxylase-like FAD-dependent oxidoreductase
MNKHIILGGGIAGIAAAIQLQKAGFEVKVFEKNDPESNEGHAFILLSNGLSALKKIGVYEEVMAQSHPIHNFHSRTVSSDRRLVQSVPNAVGIRRKTLADILAKKIKPETIEYDKSFSHFEYTATGEAQSACFQDGSSVAGDIFIGADGIWSKTRKVVHPDYRLSPVRIREVVSVVKCSKMVKQWSNTFLKTNLEDGGLAVGMLPCDAEHLVWYLQFDSQHPSLIELTLEEQRNYLFEKTCQWADPIPQLFAKTDFEKSYMWHTTDMDTLASFYHKNIVLIGDAAHVFLTLTSQGVSAALEDAICLTDLLLQNRYLNNAETTFKQYSFMRRSVVDGFLNSGRMLQQQFLSPLSLEKEVNMPLVLSD